MTLLAIQQIVGGQWLQRRQPEARVEQLLLDSRQLLGPAGVLFFALPGKRHDGGRYLPELYQRGVRHFVVGAAPDLALLPEADVLLVDDVRAALQQLAAHHRGQFDIPVLGITGSNGKTIVKEWLWQLLGPGLSIVRSPKSYNSQVGVPLSVWQMQPEHELAIFEAGISLPGEMQRLEAIIRPTVGIFTNIGPAHREGFDDDAHKIREKMRLFEHTGILVGSLDQTPLARALRAWQAQAPTTRRLLAWSRSGQPDAAVQVTAVQPLAGNRTRLHCQFPATEARPQGQAAEFEIPFGDAASVENALHCIVFAWWIGLPMAELAARLLHLEPVEMRLELKSGIQRCTLVNDFYNNDLASLRIALQFARQQARQGRLTLVLSDILQSGMPAATLWPQVAEAVRAQAVARLIGIGNGIPALRAYLPEGLETAFYPNTDDFLRDLAAHQFHDELILLKGARPFAFERIARRLEQKAHKTVLEVNLSALVHNLNTYHRLLKPGTKTMAMVKAAGYGSGSAEVAKLLEFHRVDYLGVAYADEGIELRQAGVQLPILVLNPEPASFDALYRYRLEPEVYSLRMLEELAQYAGPDKALDIHLKLDTGMHRLGFEMPDIEPLVARLQALPKLRVRSVFSHLSASDAPQHDAFTHQQASTFKALADRIEAALGYAPLRHLCNTGGIVRFPEYHFDMVRLGIGLYGIDGAGLQDQLRVVNVLKATVSQVKQVPPGDTVGYNRNSGPLPQGARIATISIGYADGLLRLAGGGRFSVLLRGHRAPTIGNVCMDMTMVDVSHIPDAQEGDEVLVFGEEPPVQELAACLQTIAYEVFTNISERVKRVYWHE
jgi:alanine racemase